MTPILYDAAETAFDTNGLGMLADATSCQVTEERNGEYELEMGYPETGALFESLSMSKIILAEPGRGRTAQPFRIYKISKPISGIVTVSARHVSYQLSYIPVIPFSPVSSAAAALSALKANAAEDCPFTFLTDVVTNGTFSVSEPQSLRSVLGGQEGSVLDVFGGEYEWDRWTVNLHAERGSDKGVTLRYGKNITDITQEENIANTVTGICPYWAGSDGDMVTLPEKVVSSDNAENFPFPLTVPLDMSGDFDEKPTEAQLRQAAQSYVNRNSLGVPAVSIDLSFVDLSQTEEYRDIAPLESVELCDTVTVIFERLGVSAEAKVVRTIYDVLAGRYTSLEIGDVKSTLSATIAAQGQEIAQKTSSSFFQAAVDRATGWITGVNGGYVVLHRDGDGRPYELLVMDTPDISTAQDVWRFNLGGFGHSSTGYNGPYSTAITQGGAIVANFITVGTMLFNMLQGGTLTLGGAANGNGVMQVLDSSGHNVVDITNSYSRFQSSGSERDIYLTNGILYTRQAGEVTGYMGSFWWANDQSLEGTTLLTAKTYLGLGHRAESGGYVSDIVINNGLNPDGYTNTILFEAGSRILTYMYLGYKSAYIFATNDGKVYANPGLHVAGDFSCSGAKNRVVPDGDGRERKYYCYETASPFFGDIGGGELDDTGRCVVAIDKTIRETVGIEYYVFIQPEAPGEFYIAEKSADFFVVEGPAGGRFAWELKARQFGYEAERLEENAKYPDMSGPNYFDLYYTQLGKTLSGKENVYERFN